MRRREDGEGPRQRIPFVDPATGEILQQRCDVLVRPSDGASIARVLDGIPRFVDAADNYAESFGWQWNHWRTQRSDRAGSSLRLGDIIRRRTRFDEYDTEGKSLLECGMGGGDDTEVLLRFPFREVHSFDLSDAVERARPLLEDPRLTISQASIFDIPYPDEAFDFVYCHRVLQHTPDPRAALRAICRKVRPGGVLFAHAYKRSWRHMLGWRYKYRFLTKRLPLSWVYWYVDRFGGALHRFNEVAYRVPGLRFLAYNFVPFYKHPADLAEEEKVPLEKLVTFDALTPRHDHPMRSSVFRGVIESEGFEIEHIVDPKVSPIYCTAVRRI